MANQAPMALTIALPFRGRGFKIHIIMATPPQKISAGLFETVSTHPHIANVYFTADGKYYFNAFTVAEKQKDGSTQNVLYARTKQVTNPVTGQTIGNTTTVGVPHTAITQTLTRAALLALTPEPPAPPKEN